MSYRYFELGKNADPEREDSLQFKNAFTVHPVSDPNLMYRLHKRFSQIELELTYLQIQQLQVGWARSALQPHSSMQRCVTFQAGSSLSSLVLNPPPAANEALALPNI